MTTPQLLRHLHLPHTTPFPHPQALQIHLTQTLLSQKLPSPPPFTPRIPLPPTLLSFTPTPVYTFGRRSPSTLLPPSSLAALCAPLHPEKTQQAGEEPQVAECVDTLRGGLTTFHGPGQLVLYPVLDLKGVRSVRYPRGLGVREYVCLLEQTTINVLSKWGISSHRTSNPGVWVTSKSIGKGGIVEEKKIAALGVHLRRNVASYGVGLNVYTDLRWFERITACGLEGLGTTNMRREGEKVREELGKGRGRKEQVLRMLGRDWAGEFVEGVWGDDVQEEDDGGEGRVKRMRWRDFHFLREEMDEMEGMVEGGGLKEWMENMESRKKVERKEKSVVRGKRKEMETGRKMKKKKVSKQAGARFGRSRTDADVEEGYEKWLRESGLK